MAGIEIDDHVAENYHALVADENRNVSYEDVATRAEAMSDTRLAAWAREQAEKAGKNTTPHDATPDAPVKSHRNVKPKDVEAKPRTAPGRRGTAKPKGTPAPEDSAEAEAENKAAEAKNA